MLTQVGVVIATNDVQSRSEGGSVAVLERGELGIGARAREVALHQHRVGGDGRDLANRRPVHDLGIRGLAGSRALNRSARVVVDAAALLLAEVNVVHRGESTQQFAGGTIEGAHGETEELEIGAGVEALEPVHRGAIVHDDQIIGHGGDVHRRETIGSALLP